MTPPVLIIAREKEKEQRPVQKEGRECVAEEML